MFVMLSRQGKDLLFWHAKTIMNIKNKQAVFITLILSSTFLLKSGYAQQGSGIQLIIQPQASAISGDIFMAPYVTLQKKFTAAFDGGVLFDYLGPHNLSLSIGILYSHKGQNSSRTINDSTYYRSPGGYSSSKSMGKSALDISLNYIKMPVRFCYFSNPESTVSFSFYVGAYVSFLLDYTMEYEDQEHVIYKSGFVGYQDSGEYDLMYSRTVKGTTYTSETGTYTLSERMFESIDAGAEFGAGAQIKMSEKIFLSAYLHYDFSFSDIISRDSKYTISQPSYYTQYMWKDVFHLNDEQTYRNSAIGLQLGVKFKI